MWFEFLSQSSNPNQFEKAGTVRLHRDGPNAKKPPWLVLLKAATTLAMIVIGFGLVMPLIPLPWWQSSLITGGTLTLYVALSYFVRPDPNTDNMGWIGGAVNDPFQARDNINRWLWKAHCFLGPGRFVSQTIIDAATLLGLVAEIEPDEPVQVEVEKAEGRRQEIEDRVEERFRESGLTGTQSLSSMRFVQEQDQS